MNIWLKFGCFLTGHNYNLIKHSSELSRKTVKKYTSAILLVILVWMFIGYTFATRYLHVGIFGGIISSLICGFVVLQIERIIILSTRINWYAKSFRVLLALVMAIIGSMIMDQIIFKEDIKLAKAELMDERVKDAVKLSEIDLREQIASYDSTIAVLNNKANALSEDLRKNPVIVTAYTNTSVVKDSEGNAVQTTNSVNRSVQDNPRKYELEQTLAQLEKLTDKRFEVEGSLTNIKDEKKEELSSTSGFLDEIKILHAVATSSWLAFSVYVLFFLFFLSIELFVVTIKLSDGESDYDQLILHQTDVRINMLNKLK